MRTLTVAVAFLTAFAPLAMGQFQSAPPQPFANRGTAQRIPASMPSSQYGQIQQVGATAPTNPEALALLEQLDQTYQQHAMIMNRLLGKVPAEMRADVQKSILDAQRGRRELRQRRQELLTANRAAAAAVSAPSGVARQTIASNDWGYSAPTPSGTRIAKPELQRKRDAWSQAYGGNHQNSGNSGPGRQASPFANFSGMPTPPQPTPPNVQNGLSQLTGDVKNAVSTGFNRLKDSGSAAAAKLDGFRRQLAAPFQTTGQNSYSDSYSAPNGYTTPNSYSAQNSYPVQPPAMTPRYPSQQFRQP